MLTWFTCRNWRTRYRHSPLLRITCSIFFTFFTLLRASLFLSTGFFMCIGKDAFCFDGARHQSCFIELLIIFAYITGVRGEPFCWPQWGDCKAYYLPCFITWCSESQQKTKSCVWRGRAALWQGAPSVCAARAYTTCWCRTVNSYENMWSTLPYCHQSPKAIPPVLCNFDLQHTARIIGEFWYWIANDWLFCELLFVDTGCPNYMPSPKINT